MNGRISLGAALVVLLLIGCATPPPAQHLAPHQYPLDYRITNRNATGLSANGLRTDRPTILDITTQRDMRLVNHVLNIDVAIHDHANITLNPAPGRYLLNCTSGCTNHTKFLLIVNESEQPKPLFY